MRTVVVDGVSDETVVKLEQRATQNGRSLSDEARQIIEDEMAGWMSEETRRIRREEAFRAMEEFRSEFASQGQTFSESAEIIRKHRDG